MNVDILCANLSSNAYGRAYMLGHILARRHAVRVLGTTFGAGIWPPCDDGTLEVVREPAHHFPRYGATMRRLAAATSAPVVLAIKPRPASFGVALMARRQTGSAVILDIDDWDLAGVYGHSALRLRLRELASAANPYSNLYLRLLTPRIRTADAITVASRPLQRRFGGTRVPHARDTATLDPACFDRQAARAALGLDGAPTVMFLGTLRPHKGLEDLVAAVTSLADIEARLVVVGAEPGDPYAAGLATLGGPRVMLRPAQPWSQIGPTLVAADAVALPQQDLPFAQAQLPAKLFDAMAMARPIVATAVGELPDILDGCGLVVPPGDVGALADAMRAVLTDTEHARQLGAAARARCVADYSWDAMEPVLDRIIHEALGHRAGSRRQP